MTPPGLSPSFPYPKNCKAIPALEEKLLRGYGGKRSFEPGTTDYPSFLLLKRNKGHIRPALYCPLRQYA